MCASLVGRFGSSAFRLSTNALLIFACGIVLLFGIGTDALPSWGSRTRWNDLLRGLAVKLNGRFKRSMVPRGTSCNCTVELKFLLSGLIPDFHAVATCLGGRALRFSGVNGRDRPRVETAADGFAGLGSYLPRLPEKLGA